MFDRLLGPKTDHADPKVRAKAFGHDSVEQDMLNEALKTERDADVLCVILNRASNVAGVLDHAQSGDGSIANQARTRLVVLAESGSDGSADDWTRVYAASRSDGWTQAQALNDMLGPVTGREQVMQGALQALPESHDLSERLLLAMATQSASSVVRRLAAQNLHSKESLEQCCHELKDKDKTVYREVKERVDAFRLDEERRALATKLLADCDSLSGMTVLAQPETVAMSQVKKQTLEQQVVELNEQAPEIAGPVVEKLAGVSGSFDQALHAARAHVENRKKLKARLKALKAQYGESAAASATDGKEEFESVKASWKSVPDHSDFEAAEFERELKNVGQLVQEHLSDSDVHDRLQRKLESWESLEEKEPPAKLLERVKREWDSVEKPRSVEQQELLQNRLDALAKRLEQRESDLAQKRTSNSQQLLLVLDEFNATMEKGEFKKAMSLNDKLKARSANRDLEPGARRRIEDTLKHAQPKLEEFRKWRHFGTQQARENLIGQANTLVSDPPTSPKELAVAVKALRESWRKLDQDDGRASEVQWQSFNTVCKEAYKPAKKHFDQLAKERKKNLGSRKTVLESLESLLSETDWSAPDWAVVSKLHKDLVIQWQRGGTIDYKVKKDLDAAFESVNVRLDEQFREERENEVLRRRRLIDQLKALKETETGGRLASAAKRAQREWRPSVQSDRKTEQALWEEFRGVCDEVFGSLKQQQKDAKAAWQADANEREEVCNQINALLLSGDDKTEEFDLRAANQATGQLDEFAKQWRQRHQIPGGVMSKLDALYKQARREVEKRIAAVIQGEEKRAVARLDALISLCQNAEEALLAGDVDPAQYAVHTVEFETVRGPVGKALQKRYGQVLKGMDGDVKVTQQLKDALQDNLSRRQELCLLGELVADIDSPGHAGEARMALKMKRLTEAMQGELPVPQKELANIINDWYTTGGVAAGEWPELHDRFAKVRAAQSGGQ